MKDVEIISQRSHKVGQVTVTTTFGRLTPRRCPTCDAPKPYLHPAVQHEGEVQMCRDPWHQG
jgi:hypothetical protein